MVIGVSILQTWIFLNVILNFKANERALIVFDVALSSSSALCFVFF